MCHALLQDPAFFRFLSRIDTELAADRRQARCVHCRGPLHSADFPRKPRGLPAAVREEYSHRLSFTCGWCEARATPVSVRFLGRRVYAAVMLMLVSPPQGCTWRELADLLAVPARTLQRWRAWWRADFQRTRFWHAARERFMPPVGGEGLPQDLLARFFGPTCHERMAQLLRFVCPLSAACVIK